MAWFVLIVINNKQLGKID